MFQTTQSPGTDRIQQVDTFSPIATTSETLPRARCCTCVVYWWKEIHCRGAIKFTEWSCVCCPWCVEETDCCQTASSNTKHVQPVDYGIGRCLSTWLYGVIFRRSRHKNKRCILSRYSSRQKLLPAIRRVSVKNFIFPQDSAPAHRARETVGVLRRETPDFISPDLWPPNSPDLIPVGYEIWAVMQRRVYRRKIHTIDELKQRLIEVWCGLEQSTVDMAIDQWRKRLACVHAKGKHFEHSLWTY